MTLTIDEEFRSLIPAMTVKEREMLETSVKKEGVRDRLSVWNGILLDGHNRYEIAIVNGIDFKVREIKLADRDEAKRWIIFNQIGRRNLRPEQARMLRGLAYRLEKQPHGGQTTGRRQKNASPPERTRDRLGRKFGVAPRTVEKAEAWVDRVEEIPGLREKIMAGEATKEELRSVPVKPPKVESKTETPDKRKGPRPVPAIKIVEKVAVSLSAQAMSLAQVDFAEVVGSEWAIELDIQLTALNVQRRRLRAAIEGGINGQGDDEGTDPGE